MAHPSQVILDAVKAQLVGNTAAGSRVHVEHLVPFEIDDLPAIDIALGSERIEEASKLGGPRVLSRTVPLTIRLFAKHASTVGATLRSLMAEVESLVKQTAAYGDDVVEVIRGDTPEMTTSIDGEQPIGSLTLPYDVTYRTVDPT